MTRDDVRRWLDRYVAAWASLDPDAVGDLFSADATYRQHPSDAGFVGRDAIVRAWTEPTGDAGSRDEPGTWDAHYEPFAVDDDRAVVVGWSRYYSDASKATVRDLYDNVFLLEFDAGGRCRMFTESYVERPRDRH